MATPLYLRKDLLIIFGITLMAIMSVSSIMSILPNIAEHMHVNRSQMGLVITAFTLPGVFLAPVAGILADRIGRKAVLIPSLLIFGVAGTMCAFAQDWHTLLMLRFIQGIGVASLNILNMTLIGDFFDGHDLAAAMGYNASMLSLGTAIFPAVGGLLAIAGWRAPFFLPLLAIPLALVVWFHLDAPRPRRNQDMGTYLQKSLAIFKTRKSILLFTLTFLTFIILYGCLITYFPLLMRKHFNSQPYVIGLIMAVSSGLTALAASQLGWMVKRFGQNNLVQLGCVFYFASMVIMPFMGHEWLYLLPIILFGLGQGLNLPLIMTYLARLAPEEMRATVMAANSMVLRLSQTVGPVLMGLVLAGFGLNAVFYAGGLTAVIMLAIMRFLVREK